MKSLYSALADFRSKVSAVAKGAENPFYKSHYADLNSILEVIKQPLTDCKLAVFHTSKNSEGYSVVTTIGHTES